MKLKIYTVGPISGLSYAECINEFKTREETLKLMGFEVFNPMLGKDFLKNMGELPSAGYNQHPIVTDKAITRVDFWMVDNSDIILANFIGAKRVSIGTVAEISRAYTKGKLVITVMEKGNIHEHAFIDQMSGIIFPTLDDAYNYLKVYKEILK